MILDDTPVIDRMTRPESELDAAWVAVYGAIADARCLLDEEAKYLEREGWRPGQLDLDLAYALEKLESALEGVSGR